MDELVDHCNCSFHQCSGSFTTFQCLCQSHPRAVEPLRAHIQVPKKKLRDLKGKRIETNKFQGTTMDSSIYLSKLGFSPPAVQIFSLLSGKNYAAWGGAVLMDYPIHVIMNAMLVHSTAVILKPWHECES